MPAVLCRCGCDCPTAVAYYGLGQKFEGDESSLICEQCEGGFHYQDRLDSYDEDNDKDHTQTISKSEYDDDALTILKKRLSSGEITVDEYDRIKERLDSE